MRAGEGGYACFGEDFGGLHRGAEDFMLKSSSPVDVMVPARSAGPLGTEAEGGSGDGERSRGRLGAGGVSLSASRPRSLSPTPLSLWARARLRSAGCLTASSLAGWVGKRWAGNPGYMGGRWWPIPPLTLWMTGISLDLGGARPFIKFWYWKNASGGGGGRGGPG